MEIEEFETLLRRVCDQLTQISRQTIFTKSKDFEIAVRNVLQGFGLAVNFDPHQYAFPDISLDNFGIEVKFTEKDTWRSVANSVFETFRDKKVEHIYVVFGKMGGVPEVKWDKYDDCVIHVRTSHVPRFELEIGADRSLFEIMGVEYGEFNRLSEADKMTHIRKYAKGRLKRGERLWWLGEDAEPEHTLPIQVRLYTSLDQDEKRRLRAESTLLCPQIVNSGRSRTKYNDVSLYLITYRGVLASQVRDLFSAGSVAMRADSTRGGIYIMRALQDIEEEMIDAAHYLDDALFEEYWGESVPPMLRIEEWLRRADHYASGWKPSRELFLDRRN